MRHKQKLSFISLGLAVLMLLVSLAAPPVLAASAIEFTENTLQVDFPYEITFSVTARADERIRALALEYGTTAVSCVRAVARQEVVIEPGKEVYAKWSWDFVDSGSLPMGAQVWWEWEAVLASGETVRSERQAQVIVDQRYTWRQTDADPADPTAVKVWYHDVSLAFAARLALIGQNTLKQMEQDFGAIPSRQVQVVLYNDTEEVSDSGLYFTEWVGGYASPAYGVVVIGVEEGDYEWGEEVIRHEFGHLVSGELTANCLAVSLPTWLSEGFSMHTEGGVAARQQDRVRQALANGTLPPLRTLAAGFSANTAEANLSYAQSGMVFEYLFNEYGGGKVLALFLAIQNGTLAEDALRQVYGLDVDGLDNAWRASLGYAGQAPPPTPTATPLPSVVPTLLLLSPFDASPTPQPTLVPAAHTPTAPPPASPTPASAPSTEAAKPTGITLPCPGSSLLVIGALLSFLLPLVVQKGRLA